MKLLCVCPGVTYATGDVYAGYLRALAAQGHEVLPYDLSGRIDDAAYYYRCKRRRDGERGKEPWPEVLTKAAMDVVPFALYHRPDWVVIFSAMYLHPDTFVLLRRAGVRVALILTESPYDDEEQARVAPWCDVVFTNERTSVAVLRRANPNTHYLPHAYDPERSATGTIPEGTPAHDVLFIGTLFEERIDLLGAVDWTGIDFAIYGGVGLLPSRHRLRRYVRGSVVANRTAQHMYRAAKINLNPYRTSRGIGRGVAHIDRAESLNPRALELAACGAFQISSYRQEADELFGGYLPTYNTPRELGLLVRDWLADDIERDQAGRELRYLAAPHTYAARAAQLTATLAGHGVASRGALAPAAD